MAQETKKVKSIVIQDALGVYYEVPIERLEEFRMADDQIESFLRFGQTNAPGDVAVGGTAQATPHTGAPSSLVRVAPSGFVRIVPSGFVRATPSGFVRIVPSGFVQTPSGFARIVPSGFARAVLPIEFAPAVVSGFNRAVPSGLVRAVPSGMVRATPSGLVRAVPSGLVRVVPSGFVRATPQQTRPESNVKSWVRFQE
jgi:hypothetical protein